MAAVRASCRTLRLCISHAPPSSLGLGLIRHLSSTSSSPSPPPSPLVELRTYVATPEGIGEYLRRTRETADLRRQLSPGWIGMWTVETGGSLGEVKHLYRYEGGWEQREVARAAMGRNEQWSKEYIPHIRPLLSSQHSMILVEAQDCLAAIEQGLASLSPHDMTSAPPAGEGLKPVFEFRRYELLPGYHTMPTLKKHMLNGLASRMAAQKCGKCVFMGHSEVGLLNVFLEIWRYDSTLQCTNARRAARASKEWQESIAGIATVTASFRTEYLRPTSFSPAQ